MEIKVMMMRIEFGDLRLGQRARDNILDCLDKNWVSGGPKVEQFETEWGALFHYKYNVAMSSGTDADINACAALYDFGAKQGDEIIMPALAFIAPANAIRVAGFTPVFVDIERHTLNINPAKIEEKITPRTRAILLVHTMGKPCAMDKIMEIAKKHKLFVIEDACEAHGAQYKNKFIGHWGDAVAFSYYAAHLVCCGEGGMVSTNNEAFAKVLQSTRSHGRRDGALYFDHIRIGFNSKMNDMEASIGLDQIGSFWQTFNKRKENLYYLLKKVKDLEKFAYFNLEEEHDVVCPHAFSITLKDPKYNCQKLSAYLEANSVKCKRNFGSIPTQQQAFAYLNHTLGSFPEAEYVGDHGIHFGIHQCLTTEDLDYVSDLLHAYFAQYESS
ncbi:DegT/DnrJ/EryC1/StrS family aminotransferase [Candidatus Woesearchaeota archaeon]|nr:DegT/DnrJ/EryC1/StrS family aminotransferase [Candidatus Woesearchaeota archaeon]